MSRRSVWLAGIAAALMANAALAQTTYSVNLAPNGLEPALLSLASQTKQQIFFSKTLVAGRQAPAVKGQLTVEQALDRMLAGSGLRARRMSAELVVIEPTRATASGETAGGSDASGGRPFGDDSGDAPTEVIATASDRDDPAVEPTTVEAVEVTGTHIRGAPIASPLVALERADLERTGRTTVAEALRTLPANFGGGAADGAATTGADRASRNPGFGTGLNLRGLGNNATLVLVNGRRMAGSGSFGDFVDISSIPTAAVERVEVLLDGASALYGADAVGGVVNIILRKDFDGAETRLLAGGATTGEPVEGQVSQVLGRRWETGGVLVAYELQRRDFLSGDDRRFSRSADLRPLGGTDHRQVNSFPGNILRRDPATGALVPSWAIPAGQDGVGLAPSDLQAGVVNLQNQRQGVDLLPRQTLNAVYVAADQSVGRIDLSADARYSARRFKIHVGAPTTSLTVTSANPFFVSPIGASSHVIAYSFAEQLPAPEQAGLVETLALSLGGNARLAGGWRGDGYLTFGQEIAEIRQSGAINTITLNEALGGVADRPDTPYSPTRDGFFNPFAGQPGANSETVLAYIGSGNTYQRSRSRVATANLQFDGALWHLPAGPLKLAFGAQARRETLRRTGFNWVSSVTPTPTAGTDVARNVTAGFAELRVPLFSADNRRPGLETLELSLAGRVEHYQAVGTTMNPKIGVLWAPTRGLQVRATYGTSFRAPALRELTDNPTYSPTLLTLGSGRVRTLVLNGGNPDLEPETARSWTVGADLAPARWPGLKLSLTWFDVRFRDRIGLPVQQNLSRALTDPTLAPFVTRISPATNPTDLARITELLSSPYVSTLNGVFPPEAFGAIADNRYVNTTTLRVEGLDLSGAYRFDVGDDRISLGASATYLFRYEQQITPTSPVVDVVNVANFPVRFRGRATADWTRGRMTTGLAVNYVGAYRDAAGARISDQATLDLQLKLAPPERGAMRGVAVTFNVRNLFDADPPFYDNPIGVAYDAAVADPIGRYVSLQLTRTW